MSVEATENPEAVELPASGDAAFASLMDALAPATDAEAAGAGGGTPDPAAAGSGQPAPADQGTAAPVAGVGTPGAGGAGEPGVQAVDPAAVAPAGGAAAGVDSSAAGDVDALTLAPKWGEVSTALEAKHSQVFQETALEEVRGEYPEYFDALNKHPRLLVGQEVPAIGSEGKETLRDSDDAREWQDAVKGLLIEEVKDRAVRLSEAGGPELTTVHAAIELFQNNIDIIPGTKQFDRELADRFVELAKPYVHEVDGKIQGWTIPVQPLVNQLRAQITAQRAAAPAAPAAPVAAAAAPAIDPPQAGIPSRAGSGGESEDFSTLFGTIGLPGLRF